MAPEAAGGAAETVKAARGNSNSADGDSREEETTGNDGARKGRAVGPASEKEGRLVAVAGRGVDADDWAAETTGETGSATRLGMIGKEAPSNDPEIVLEEAVVVIGPAAPEGGRSSAQTALGRPSGRG